MNKDRAIVLISTEEDLKKHWMQFLRPQDCFRITGYEHLKSPFGLGDVLKNEPDVVIVEDCPVSILEDSWIKALLSVKEIRTERKGENPREVIQPRWIFTIELPEEYAQQFKIIPLD